MAKKTKHDDAKILGEVFRPMTERNTIEYLKAVFLERLRPWGAENWPHHLPESVDIEQWPESWRQAWPNDLAYATQPWPDGTPAEEKKIAEDARNGLHEIRSIELGLANGQAEADPAAMLRLGAIAIMMGTRRQEPLAERGRSAKRAESKSAATRRAPFIPTWRKIKRRFAAIHPAEVASKVAAVHRVARECKVKPRTVYRALKREI